MSDQIEADLEAIRLCLFTGQKSSRKAAAQRAFKRVSACVRANHAQTKRADSPTRMGVEDEEVVRQELVDLCRKMISRAHLPRGYNAVAVTTDDKGAWCAVSSSDDAYTFKLLMAALNGEGLRLHKRGRSLAASRRA